MPLEDVVRRRSRHRAALARKSRSTARSSAGHSEVNEAPLTGESLPIDKAPGDEVYAGTINGRGALDLRVTRVGRDTRLARISHLVEEAQSRRAPVQSFVDRFARIYTPLVIALAAVVAIVPPLVMGADASTWIYRALTLLVISCPCALVISTPVSIVSALRRPRAMASWSKGARISSGSPTWARSRSTRRAP